MADIEVPEEYSLDDLLAEEVPSVTVTVGKKEKTFWIRPPTDSERAMSQNAARQVSRKLRERLLDPETEEHQLLVNAEMDNMSSEELRLVWLTSNLFQKALEVQRRSLDSRDDYFVPTPEGKEDGLIPPSGAEMDEYETNKREQEAQRLRDVSEQQTVIYNELKEKSDNMSDDALRDIISPLIIDQQTSREWQAQYGLQILSRCTFLDQDLTERAFKTVEEALRLHNTKSGQRVLDSLLNAHSGLMLDPDRIKN
jgi:hypothetical protein